ncbi:transposase [Amycolatopsis sp. GM8]|uniref:transposase n=1 Tax=Amycolatopsis sp. GM8 TaxID=2896530 RepID=UPI0035ABF8BE
MPDATVCDRSHTFAHPDLTTFCLPRRLAHEPLGWRPTTLLVTIRRHNCTGCGHVWRHISRGDKYVTVITDLTPVRDGTGPARLLDMVEGRSKQAFKTWLIERPGPWRDAVEVVAMDG